MINIFNNVMKLLNSYYRHFCLLSMLVVNRKLVYAADAGLFSRLNTSQPYLKNAYN